MNARLASVTLAALAAAAVSAQSAQLGSWDIIGNSGVTCIHTMLLPEGRLMCIERPHKGPFYPGNSVNNRTVALIQLEGEGNPVVGSSKVMDGASEVYANSFCGGHVQMANGSILVVGGDKQEWADEAGNRFLVSGGSGVRVYDPCTTPDCQQGQWSAAPNMTTTRWYPTVVTLADGNAIIIGGSLENINMQAPDPDGNDNPTYEYLHPPNVGSWPRNISLLTWAFPHSLYPPAVLMPNEKVFVLISNKSLVIDPKEDFSDPNAQPSFPITDLTPDKFPNNPKHSPWIYPHSATMTVLPMTKKNNHSFVVQFCGGSQHPDSAPRPYASASCVTINPNDVTPEWSAPDPMPHARVMLDSIILPDGKILYANGAGWGQAGGDAGQAQYAADPVYAVDLFDPDAPSGSQWTSLQNATVPRLYHSGMILLPSGHVITTGSEMQNYVDFWGSGGPNISCYPSATYDGPKTWTAKPMCTSPFEQRIERFTPPYLLSTIARPSIITAPTTLTYQSRFKITVAGTVDRVTLIRYSTSTHGLNTDQRFWELEIVARDGNDIYMNAPPSGGYMPPGNHMIWALNSGIPSIAATILLQNGNVTQVPIPAGANVTVTPAAAANATGSGPAGGPSGTAPGGAGANSSASASSTSAPTPVSTAGGKSAASKVAGVAGSVAAVAVMAVAAAFL
ncbi:hypothetical protein BDK51DRAFT_15919 [Blyttiomyces helicus]|uniref:Glyoxal oxidase N-terminus-domain-containing protein n=1 Tax=Blyttiomyces helicus TaxID=388810 RepID=A0A4P9WAG8_9FUNG|nr:hypothetical protein BDK51DRAFT_15919 [Blyttiomyces helicus]|eukprot:RKO89589.1 hypothetical protein BDK51DRAFT_15919 [Blyttiomyces helicus]